MLTRHLAPYVFISTGPVNLGYQSIRLSHCLIIGWGREKKGEGAERGLDEGLDLKLEMGGGG